MRLERFHLYQSAFPMETYRLVLAEQVMAGDYIMVPESLDRDEVEMSFMGDVFHQVERASLALDLVTLYLRDDEVLRMDSRAPIILRDDPLEGEEIH